MIDSPPRQRWIPVIACLAALPVSVATAQQLRTTHVEGNIYLISGAGGNVTVSVGDSGVLIVDSGSAEFSDDLLTAIQSIADGTIRYVVNTRLHADHVGGNAALRAAGDTFTGGNATVVGGVDEGAAVIGHENLLLRMALDSDFDPELQPTETFFVPRIDLYFNGEPVEIIHQPNANDDTNTMVHFRRSDVIATGDVLHLDAFPPIDLDNGGSIQGILAALNGLVELAVSDTLAEGGTLIVPGHGRICDEGDLVRYRDMLTVIRDRIAAWIDRGHSLEEIKRAQPTFEYDSRYGATRGEWTTEMFIEAVYRSLLAERPPSSAAN